MPAAEAPRSEPQTDQSRTGQSRTGQPRTERDPADPYRSRSRPGRPPNVVVLLTDQQRWDTTGLHGNPLDLTPNFDRMAGGGTHVRHAFTPQPVCGPARSALQTGRYATAVGCHRNGLPLPTDARTLAHEFAGAGYATGYIGKWHLAPGERGPVAPEHRGGYDYWLASNVLEFTSDAYRTIVYDNDERPVLLPGYRTDALTDAAIRYAVDHRDEPFYLFVSYIEPHHQNELDTYPAPDGYAERYAGRWTPGDLAGAPEQGTSAQHMGGYCGQIRRLDEGLGRFLEALRTLGLGEDTIVCWTSDHGNHFKTRNFEYKRSWHESSIRVPLGLTGPGFAGGYQVNEMVSTLDLPPTLLDAAGIAVPDAMQGRSFLPLVRAGAPDPTDPTGVAATWPAEAFIQVSESAVARAIRTPRWTYAVVAPDAHPREDAGSDRYVEHALYDVVNDPYELDNRIGLATYREVAADLRARLVARMVEAGEPEPRIEPAAERKPGQRSPDPHVWSLDLPTTVGHEAATRSPRDRAG